MGWICDSKQLRIQFSVYSVPRAEGNSCAERKEGNEKLFLPLLVLLLQPLEGLLSAFLQPGSCCIISHVLIDAFYINSLLVGCVCVCVLSVPPSKGWLSPVPFTFPRSSQSQTLKELSQVLSFGQLLEENRLRRPAPRPRPPAFQT